MYKNYIYIQRMRYREGFNTAELTACTPLFIVEVGNSVVGELNKEQSIMVNVFHRNSRT